MSVAASVYSLPTTPLKVQPATFTVPPEAVRIVQDDNVPPEPLAMVKLMVSLAAKLVMTVPFLLLTVTTG